MKTSQEKLHATATAISTAVLVLKMEMPTIEAFLKECRDMENFGHVTHPSLYRDSERKAVSALLEPLFQAALLFVRSHDEQIARSKAALEKVST